MGFTKYFFIFLAALLVLGLGAWIFVIQGRVYLASWKLQRDFDYTAALAKKPQHIQACTLPDEERLFDEDSLSPLLGYRLRFESDTSYMIEAVCRKEYMGPFEVKREQLWHGVKKIAGSGVMIDHENAERIDGRVLLGLGERMQVIGFEKGELISRMQNTRSAFSEGVHAAKTNCEGWGFKCCNQVTEVGIGASESRTLACEGGCFESCMSRPTVTLFNTEPPMNRELRSLITAGNQALVRFAYRVVDPDGKIERVVVDFGDGTKQESEVDREIMEHVFYCSKSPCVYNVALQAYDNDGLELAKTRLQEILIEMR